ncbi:pentapeptide repeat-containing protein [Spirulina sp. CS-785/01]|uniref:nSTAND1 domain-containing NTPase n=1 Tax=Spirulina sp. CS-785/01 TaxID=3021716 RepID=UPI00232B7734|nr:pentapeptide repeat-containing protein [Spirulina sp. CS-785/01]MDB9314020.1 pentapeptide repeat-containing protein [Spirulina sp. CS-785/01]
MQQEIEQLKDSQAIANMVNSTAINVRQMEQGSLLISGENHQVVIYQSQLEQHLPTPPQPETKLGANPYKGLLAFQEEDCDRFFGRESQVQALWEQLRDRYQQDNQPRFLPVYGPSGSGKSSLVRGGLIPQLVRQPLPVWESAPIAVLVPGAHPLEALAAVLARIATDDPIPVAKSEEFLQVLQQEGEGEGLQERFTGLRKIAALLPNIHQSPLLVLVDQFEEIYTLCASEQEREAFLGNLLHAACDGSKQVGVVVTFRSDFLRELQRHPQFYRLFSEQGYLVSPLLPEELRRAIAKPAELAGHPLPEAVIDRLLLEMEGQENALPLLQFALTRIWEGLEAGVEAHETLEQIGGVGGALAGEARRLYETLEERDRILARRIFLGLVQLGEGTEDTRRRVAVSELISTPEEHQRVEAIIHKFAAPGVRFLAVAADQDQRETVEVAHEALIRNWEQLQEWIEDCRAALRQKRKIERSAQDWEAVGKSKGYLLQGRPLRDAREFFKQCNGETALSELAVDFVEKSQRKRKQNLYTQIALIGIFPTLLTIVSIHFLIITATQILLARENCSPTPILKTLLSYMHRTGYKKNFDGLYLCGKNMSGINLSDSELEESVFKNAKLSRANFNKSILYSADFRNAELINAQFYKAILGNADFRDADLEGAVLKEAYLDNAKLHGAILNNAILQDVNLENTVGLQEDQLQQAILCNTILPEILGKLPNNFGDKDCDKLKHKSL